MEIIKCTGNLRIKKDKIEIKNFLNFQRKMHKRSGVLPGAKQVWKEKPLNLKELAVGHKLLSIDIF